MGERQDPKNTLSRRDFLKLVATLPFAASNLESYLSPQTPPLLPIPLPPPLNEMEFFFHVLANKYPSNGLVNGLKTFSSTDEIMSEVRLNYDKLSGLPPTVYGGRLVDYKNTVFDYNNNTTTIPLKPVSPIIKDGLNIVPEFSITTSNELTGARPLIEVLIKEDPSIEYKEAEYLARKIGNLYLNQASILNDEMKLSKNNVTTLSLVKTQLQFPVNTDGSTYVYHIVDMGPNLLEYLATKERLDIVELANIKRQAMHLLLKLKKEGIHCVKFTPELIRISPDGIVSFDFTDNIRWVVSPISPTDEFALELLENADDQFNIAMQMLTHRAEQNGIPVFNSDQSARNTLMNRNPEILVERLLVDESDQVIPVDDLNSNKPTLVPPITLNIRDKYTEKPRRTPVRISTVNGVQSDLWLTPEEHLILKKGNLTEISKLLGDHQIPEVVKVYATQEDIAISLLSGGNGAEKWLTDKGIYDKVMRYWILEGGKADDFAKNGFDLVNLMQRHHMFGGSKVEDWFMKAAKLMKEYPVIGNALKDLGIAFTAGLLIWDVFNMENLVTNTYEIKPKGNFFNNASIPEPTNPSYYDLYRLLTETGIGYGPQTEKYEISINRLFADMTTVINNKSTEELKIIMQESMILKDLFSQLSGFYSMRIIKLDDSTFPEIPVLSMGLDNNFDINTPLIAVTTKLKSAGDENDELRIINSQTGDVFVFVRTAANWIFSPLKKDGTKMDKGMQYVAQIRTRTIVEGQPVDLPLPFMATVKADDGLVGNDMVFVTQGNLYPDPEYEGNYAGE